MALRGETYAINGLGGKQVRDQIHGADVIRAFEAFYHNPRPGEVYNLGGGRSNAASLLEQLDIVGQVTGRTIATTNEPIARVGDPICSISTLAKLRTHFPDRELTHSLGGIVEDVVSNARDVPGLWSA